MLNLDMPTILNILRELAYPFFALFLLVLTIVYVPKQKFGSLFWVSLVWGFFFSIIFNLIFGEWLHLFHWEHAYPFIFLGSPIWLSIAWLAAIMFYLRFIPTREVWYVFPVYLLVFVFASLALETIFNQAGLFFYTGWNPFYRFLASLILFYGAAWHQRVLSKARAKDSQDVT
jgi:hypothetical protein